MFKKIKGLIVLGLFVFATIANAESGVSMSESNIHSKVGNTMLVDVLMSDFVFTEGGGIDMHFNPALVQVNSVVVDGDTWGFVNRDGSINNTDGLVSGILFSSYQGLSGNAKIATIELEFVGKGRGEISMSESASNLFAGNGEHLAVTFSSTRIHVRR